MNKKKRHQCILQAIKTGSVSSQAELHQLLKKKGGSVTQATLSRDMGELGLLKKSGIYQSPQKSDLPFSFGRVDSIMPIGENLLLIKTSAGLANGIAELIDLKSSKGIAGTIAGDNTILVALNNGTNPNQALKNITSILSHSARRLR